MVKLSSRRVPGLPLAADLFARKTLNLSVSCSNHAPGFGLRP